MQEEKLENLKTRFENQIEKMLDTIVEMEKLEQGEPWRQLSNWHQVALSMCFFNILTQSMWENILKWKWLTQEQKEKYCQESGEATYEHFLNLYWFDAKMKVD